MLLFESCFLFLIRDSTELRRTGPVVLFWFFHTIDLEKCVIAINTFYFSSFAGVKNTIKRTAPRRSRTLARSVRRVIACQSRASEHTRLSGGSMEKKNSVSYWPEPSREPSVGSELWSSCLHNSSSTWVTVCCSCALLPSR